MRRTFDPELSQKLDLVSALLGMRIPAKLRAMLTLYKRFLEKGIAR